MAFQHAKYLASSSPSKIEGAGGSMKTDIFYNHTPQSLRDSSSKLEEQLECFAFLHTFS